MSGKTEYCLCTKNDSSLPPIADICIITIDGKEQCPEGYVKLPFTINNLAICFRHLPMDALGLRYQTCILDRYPRIDYANSPLSNTVAVFCQPNGADIRNEASMPTFLSFVLTDSEGRKMYAITVTFYDKLEEEDEQCCKRSLQQIYTDGFKPIWPDKDKTKQLYHSKSVCILSYYPFFLSFREVLKEIYRLANSPGKIPIERYIVNLCEETPLPIPNKRSVQLLYAHKPIIFKIPNDDELPLLDSNIKKIFCCLSLNNTLELFRVLISQKYKILFTSSHISLITEICEGLTSFMQPFEWQFTYVPVLPYSVFGILDAPVPVLVGMHSSRIKPDYYSDPEKELVIVDLDSNRIHIPQQCKDGLIDIPQQLFKPLKHDLKQYAKANKVPIYDKNTIQFVDSAFNVQLMGDEDDEHDQILNINRFNPMACRAQFYKFWCKILGPTYKEYLQFPDNDEIMDINDIFDIESFISSRPKNMRKFLRTFSQTQAFQKFVEDLTYESTEDRAVALNAFYKCCQYYQHQNQISHQNGSASPRLSKSNFSTQSLSMSMSTNSDKGQSPLSSSSNNLYHRNGGNNYHNNNNNNKHSQIDPFTEFLEQRIPDLMPYQVEQANEDKLDEKYRFQVQSAFPTINDKYLIKPRICNLLQLIGDKDSNNININNDNNNISLEEEKKDNDKKPKLKLNNTDISHQPMISRQNTGPKRKGSALRAGNTPIDRAKHLLLQIYGTWFAAHVAALDFKDIPGDEVELVVKSTLDILYRMTDENTSRDIKLIPDELIYKACLILCGKFGKKKEASKLFKDLKKNGITPSQKTYGAYTNAMASSGANMLLSAAGSTSSGASSLAGRTHRRSFAPTNDSLGGRSARSFSAAINPNSRLHAPHKINTIAEDEEHNNHNLNLDSPYTDDDEQKSPLKLLHQSSSPYVALQQHNNHYNNNNNNNNEEKKVEPDLNKHKSVDVVKSDISSSGLPQMMKNAKSSPNSHLKIKNSHSTPTPSPKIEEEPPPLAPPTSSNDDHSQYMNGSLDIKQEPWKDPESTEDDDDQEPEEKEQQPIYSNGGGSSQLKTPQSNKTSATTTTTTTTATSTTYSTPSVLSSQISAASSMSQTPEPQQKPSSKIESDLPELTENESGRERTSQPIISTNPIASKKPDKVAIIIDYSTLKIEAKHECKCGYVLSDAQIMVGWCSEFTASNSLRCIMCRQNSFSPKLHLRYNITKMSMQNGICSFETIDKYIEYISPLQLRSKVNFILQHRRLDFEDPETFRANHETEFWNMIWYFSNRKFDLSFLLGEHDAESVQIEPFSNINKDDDKEQDQEQQEAQEEELIILEPKSDEELLLKLKPIYEKATNNKIREAISEWLLNRSQTPSEKRELSIWNLSVFDSFHDLGIPLKFKSYQLFIKEFKNACRNIRPKIRDRAWDDPSLAIQTCFKHPRISNQRLQQMTQKLSGKPLRPNIPVPIPPSKK